MLKGTSCTENQRRSVPFSKLLADRGWCSRCPDNAAGFCNRPCRGHAHRQRPLVREPLWGVDRVFARVAHGQQRQPVRRPNHRPLDLARLDRRPRGPRPAPTPRGRRWGCAGRVRLAARHAPARHHHQGDCRTGAQRAQHHRGPRGGTGAGAVSPATADAARGCAAAATRQARRPHGRRGTTPCPPPARGTAASPAVTAGAVGPPTHPVEVLPGSSMARHMRCIDADGAPRCGPGVQGLHGRMVALQTITRATAVPRARGVVCMQKRWMCSICTANHSVRVS